MHMPSEQVIIGTKGMDDLEQGPRSTGTGSASPFALTNAFQWGDAESDEDGAGNA